MIWTTTGNLSNIRSHATFRSGVPMLPAGRRGGSPTGGGNFYLFKSATGAEREGEIASIAGSTVLSARRSGPSTLVTLRRARMPGRERQCGNIAVIFPAATVAREQLQFAVAELSTHDNHRVAQALNDGLEAALIGKKQPDAALHQAQATAVRLLRPFQ